LLKAAGEVFPKDLHEGIRRRCRGLGGVACSGEFVQKRPDVDSIELGERTSQRPVGDVRRAGTAGCRRKERERRGESSVHGFPSISGKTLPRPTRRVNRCGVYFAAGSIFAGTGTSISAGRDRLSE